MLHINYASYLLFFIFIILHHNIKVYQSFLSFIIQYIDVWVEEAELQQLATSYQRKRKLNIYLNITNFFNFLEKNASGRYITQFFKSMKQSNLKKFQSNFLNLQ